MSIRPKASPLLRAWLRELSGLGAVLETRRHWAGWDEKGALLFSDGSVANADVCVLVILTAGQKGDVPQAQALLDGLKASHVLADKAYDSNALRKFIADNGAQAVIPCNPTRKHLIATGLEGGAIYALSRDLRAALARSGRCELRLDLRPDLDAGQLAARLAKVPRKQSLSNRMRKAAGLSPQAMSVWRDCTDVHALPTDAALARSLKAVAVTVTGLQPIDRAISSAGGIAVGEVDADFMLKKLPGVFVCGEMLDWDAPTGGCLLQACFATGRAAGEAAAQYAQRPVRHALAGTR